jgi:hypothetical protein
MYSRFVNIRRISVVNPWCEYLLVLIKRIENVIALLTHYLALGIKAQSELEGKPNAACFLAPLHRDKDA